MFDPAGMPPPLPRIQDTATRPTGGLDHHFEVYDRRQREVSKIPLNTDTACQLRANYAGKVALIDAHIGRILDVIEARGELDNTILVFTSDHGEMNGDHGLVYKSNFLNGAARIPLVISTPAMRASQSGGGICASPAELIDVGATLADLAGATWDWEQFGVSLAPTLDTPGARHREDALCEFEGEVMLLTDRWKAAINREGQLYLLIDRQADADEQHNLAGCPEHRETGDRLRLRILERLAQSQKQQAICGYICS